MKPFLQKLLRCPKDLQSLELVAFNSQPFRLAKTDQERIENFGYSPIDFAEEIGDGLLLNQRLKVIYPIFNGVPRMLVFRHPLIAEFQRRFAKELSDFLNKGYKFPDFESAPGEDNVLASFSNEWKSYGYNDEVYWGQSTKAYNDSLFATINNEEQNLRGKIVLEVGIGSGGSANDFANRFQSMLIGVDLGYSTDVAYQNFKSNPFFHIAQASVFALPFAHETFDFVYSHGVIHHTFSTKTAFTQLTKLPKKGGRLYIWVYSYKNESRSLKRRVIMLMERLIRPWCSALPGWLQTIVLQPIAPLYIFHQNSVQVGKQGMVKYRFREALHAARDRFTPKYIHRHTEEEVIKWFEECDYEKVTPLSAKTFPESTPVNFYMNTGVEGFKK